jgi:hypothetical protein
MIAVTPALHLLVALSLAAPAVDPSTCAAEDLRCSAPAFAAAARRAGSDAERVEYLYFATRAYLALAEKSSVASASSRDLCKAKQLIDQAVKLPVTELRGRVVESRRVTLSRLTAQQVQCKRPKEGKKHDAPIVALADADPPTELLAPAPVDDLAVARSTSPETTVAAHDLTPRPSPAATSNMSPMRPVGDGADAAPGESRGKQGALHQPSPGRRLLISGGVSLAAGLALTGVAAYTGTQALGARREGHESTELEGTTENLMRNEALEDEYRRLGPVAIATGIAGGAAVVAGIVMLCMGARRKARAADSEPMLMPVRTGLLFTVRF